MCGSGPTPALRSPCGRRVGCRSTPEPQLCGRPPGGAIATDVARMRKRNGSMHVPPHERPACSLSSHGLNRRLGLSGDDVTDADPRQALNLAVAALLVEILRADLRRGWRGTRTGDRARSCGCSGSPRRPAGHWWRMPSARSTARTTFTSSRRRSIARSRTPKNCACSSSSGASPQADDAVVHKYEEHLIRRIADLLHVPHSGFIAAKLRAERERAGSVTGVAEYAPASSKTRPIASQFPAAELAAPGLARVRSA